MVAIDNQMRPIPIPQFTPVSDSDLIEHQKAINIRKHMLDLKDNS